MPVTNLKDRIAALEQQRNAAGTQRSASSSPQIGSAGPSSTNGSPSVGALRDKIAKFEKKGGVPVPRGTFGLGAPPPPEARVSRNGELYGNRPGIPQPLRMLSAQHTGGSMSGMSSRSGSSLGFYGSDNDWRQSVSSVITDLDDRPDYTPLTSPTFGLGPTSPDSPGSTTAGYTPEGSPTLSPPPAGIQAEINAPKPVVSRSTSFAVAVEMAKKVAENGANGGVEKVLQDGASPTPFIVNTAAIKQSLERSASSDRAEDIHAPSGKPAATDSKPVVVDDVFTAEPANVTSPSQLPYQSPTVPSIASPIASSVEASTPTAASFSSLTPDTPVASAATQSQEDNTEALEKPGAPSIVPAVQVTPESNAVASPSSQETPSFQPRSSAPSPEEIKKGSSRNNKDLTLNVDALKAQPKPTIEKSEATPTDETTPTTSTYLNVLSPPSSALSTTSIGTPESMISPRPYSMVEFSMAERVTPATSRGNVMFIAPSTATLPRKSDMAFYPPTPTKDESKAPDESQKEKGSQEPKPAFTTVVHEKVREAEVALPAAKTTTATTTRSRSGSAPQTPKRNKHMTLLPLNSPAQPELFSLLQNAVMLESTLEHGELPEEANLRKERERKEAARKREAETLAAALEADKAKAKEAEDKLLAFREKEKQKELEDSEQSKKAKLRHTFLIPLSKAKSVHGATAEEEAKQSKELPELPDVLPSPDAGVDPASAYPSLHSALQSAAPTPATPVVIPPPPLQSAPQSQSTFHNLPPPPPIPRDQPPAHDPNDRLRPKSASVTKSRFSLRKFGSVKSVIGLGGGNSSRRSDMSDSMSISDAASFSSIGGDGSTLGHGDMDEFGGMPRPSQHHEREGTWPSTNLSPTKKGGMSRASTIGKMFSRSRKQSNGSTTSHMSGSSRAASIYTLPPLPDSLGVVPPSPEGEQPRDRQPRRSMSMKSLKGALKGRASMDKDRAPAPPVPQIRTESVPSNNYNPRESSSLASSTGGSTSPTSTLGSPGQLRSPDYIGYGSMNIPSDRPTSWMSVSSLESSLPSPLFEKDIFDAFPAVPSSAAITPGAASVHRFGGPGGLGSLDQGLQSAALMTPSFDSAFLGSAIHLAGSHKSTLGTPTTATGSFTQQAPPTPKISAAPSGLSGQGRPKSRTGSVHRS